MNSVYYTQERDTTSEKKAQVISIVITLILGLIVILISYFFKQNIIKSNEPELIVLDFSVEAEEKIPPLDLPKKIEEVKKIEPKKIQTNAKSGGASSKPAQSSNKETSARDKESSSKNNKPVINKSSLSDKNKSTVSAQKNTADKNKNDLDKQRQKDDKAKKAFENMKKGKNTSGGAGDSNSKNKSGVGGKGVREGKGDGKGSGNGSGNNKMGENGRSLLSYIPGTEGRGGKLPKHSCKATGLIIFKYKVDKTGKVISVQRSSGSTNPCIVNLGIEWIKKYVRANTGSSNVEGTYRITF